MYRSIKTILMALLLLFITTAKAQHTFKRQLDQLMADSNNYFQKFRAGFKEIRGRDSVFFSRINLDGTADNDISHQAHPGSKPFGMYLAIVSDSVSQAIGTRMIKMWKQKLATLLEPSFKCRKLEPAIIDPYKSGWAFRRRNLTISITMLRANTPKELYFILLNVFYFTDKNTIKL